MCRAQRAVIVTALAVTSVLALGSSAAAAPPSNASCVAQVFVPQATGEPGTVARRIAEIKGFIDFPWGVIMRDFDDFCDRH